MPSVKCAKCGLLAVRDENGNGALEAIEAIRKTGILPCRTGSTINAKFFCKRQSEAFPPLVHDPVRSQLSPPENPAVVTLNKDRECGVYRLWIPGKTPKEHEEMTIIERIERLNNQMRQEDILRQEKWNRHNSRWTVVAGIAAVLRRACRNCSIFLTSLTAKWG